MSYINLLKSTLDEIDETCDGIHWSPFYVSIDPVKRQELNMKSQ